MSLNIFGFFKYLSVLFTAISLAVTFWLQYEKFRLDGEWKLDTCTDQADFLPYQGLHLAWGLFLSDDPLSAPVVGDGEKVEEAFTALPHTDRHPARFVGSKEINSVSLIGRFEGATRAYTGRFELKPVRSRGVLSGYVPFYQRKVEVLEGTFALTAGNSRGRARAVRLEDGVLPTGIPTFSCQSLRAG